MKPFFSEVVGAISQVLQLLETPNWNDATRLEADLGMDSGLMLELIMQIEETIPGVVIDQATLSYEQFETIGSVCDFVRTSQQQEAIA
jgi:acyl carrier protein